MLLIAKRTAIGAALLLVMPVIVWLSGWQWQPGQAPAMLKMWYWVGNNYSCSSIWLVFVVFTVSSARSAGAVSHSRRRHPGRSGA